MVEKRIMQRAFYLAGPYDRRPHLAVVARDVERRTGWKCTSRWLTGQHDDSAPELAAAEDIADVLAADALLLCHGKSTAGGMWIEFGMALAQHKPIVVFARTPLVYPLSVFCAHELVRKVQLLDEIEGAFRWAQTLTDNYPDQ